MEQLANVISQYETINDLLKVLNDSSELKSIKELVEYLEDDLEYTNY